MHLPLLHEKVLHALWNLPLLLEEVIKLIPISELSLEEVMKLVPTSALLLKEVVKLVPISVLLLKEVVKLVPILLLLREEEAKLEATAEVAALRPLRLGVGGGLEVRPGMMLEDFAAQRLAVDVRVNLGGSDFLVPQHLLDGAEVGPALEEVRREGVAEGMRADGLVDTRERGLLLDDGENHDAGEGRTATVEEKVVLVAGLGGDGLAVGQVEADFAEGGLGDGDEALLAALAPDADKLFPAVNVAVPEVYQLGDTEAAAVEHLEHGTVAVALGLAEVDAGEDGVDFIDGEDLGEAHPNLGGLEELRRVGVEVIFEDEVMVERLDTRDDTRLRAGMDADVAELGDELLEVVVGDVEDRLAEVVGEAVELVHVADVSLYRIGGKATLELEEILVRLEEVPLYLLIIHNS